MLRSHQPNLKGGLIAETVMCSRLLVNFVDVPHRYILKADFPVKESDVNRVCHWEPCCI